MPLIAIEDHAAAKAWVEQRGLARLAPGLAVDLGCGPGFHAIALAEAGFETLAIDSSKELLALVAHPRVRAVAGELLAAIVERGLGKDTARRFQNGRP